MNSCCRALLVVLCLSRSLPALAQPTEAELYPVPAPPVVVPVACPAGRSDSRACLRPLLEANPQYQAAKARRNAGIVLTAVGSNVGVLAAVIAWASYVGRDVSCWGCHNDYTGEKIVAGLGAGVLVLSLAIGIPTIVSAASAMRAVRRQYQELVPVPMVSVSPQRTTFGATWRF